MRKIIQWARDRLAQAGLIVGLMLASALAPAQTVTYFHNDASGTPVLATDAGGNVVWKENYRPYGDRLNNPSAEAGNAIGFAGKPFDAATGLSYMGARYYDPVIGRFMGVDAAPADPGSVHGFNRYAYANNNPYKYVDPDGHSPIDVAFLVWDLGKLGVAVYTGVGVGAAAADVALSTLGVISPVPGVGEVLKGARVIERGVEAARVADHGIEAARGVERTAEVAKTAEEGAGAYKKYTTGGSFSKKTKSDIADQAGHQCEYCGVNTVAARKSERGVKPPRNEGQTDHIVPRSEGGTNAPSNAAHACRGCNRDFSNTPKPSPRE